ncbi:pyridoxal phosphate phosphatase PHOSPHO2-like [Amyelois transitella]|uniref:pyridoxal phosphate phosphatase PHOSPHO2-like n=1 Tax=Amyelois transitella TaxID=680683 RepID=UPI00299007D5|nr:pyridoxal phosphate phosphatase PHOSPHO2-like [Amyelois transitella]
MVSLAVFDFDRTIVDDDSDATIINKLREKQPPPEWETSNHDWTPYMSDVFEHAYSAGLSQDDILSAIASMRENPGVSELVRTLAASGWDVLLLTDANSVFVDHWLKSHGLQEAVTQVMTNRAFWQSGRLYIEPLMRQTACSRCPRNLCKSIALAQFIAQRPQYDRVVYAGDGRNDFCPATNLPPHAIVFPRRGYPLDELVKKTLASPTPLVQAKVVPWDDFYTIMKELFPEKSIS